MLIIDEEVLKSDIKTAHYGKERKNWCRYSNSLIVNEYFPKLTANELLNI